MEQSEIYALFSKRKKRRAWVTCTMLTVFVGILFINAAFEDLGEMTKTILLWTAIIDFCASLAFIFYDWRCPSCDRPLGRENNINYCNHCGAKLTEFID